MMARQSTWKNNEAEKRIDDAIRNNSLSLELRGLRLTELPPSLSQLNRLEKLDLGDNQLATLPEWLRQLTQLRRLYLFGNQLPTLPAWFSQLAELRFLVLDGNPLQKVPGCLSQLPKLQRLNLGANQLIELPSWLGLLAELESLYLFDNQLTTLPESLGQLTKLEELVLSYNQFASLPECVGRLTKLQRLNLFSNRLETLPGWLGQLTQLQQLGLGHNRLAMTPETLGQLIRLDTLILGGNQLTTLPVWIGQLTRLQMLDLSGNELVGLPDILDKINQLRILNLSGNQLVTLPDSLCGLTQLRELDLSGNQLKTLPAGLADLSDLQRLDLSDNKLRVFPRSMKNVQSLERLFLHGNYDLNLPQSILGPDRKTVGLKNERATTPQVILDYYFGKQLAGRPLNEMKLLLVGRGGAGKTSICRALQGLPFNPRLKETKGITIIPWVLRAGKDQIKVHTWDFAGQVITHAAHQFFFTQQSLYILVLTGRENNERTDAEYWLRLIQAFGADRASGQISPVIVALNKSKSHPCHLDRNALQEKYPFIVAFVDTDCKTGTGISRLKQTMKETVERLPAVRLTFPSAWWVIKEELERKDRNHLSYGDYRILCARMGELDESKQDSLATILHALGVALNYADDMRLRDTTILNPHWVTNALYALLRDAARDDGSGELHLKDVQRALSKETPAMQRYIVELMRRFELAFPLNEAADRWLVPQRLADTQPKLTAEWQGAGVTRLRYCYMALPEGLLPRFITRTYPLSEGQPRWVNGVILEENGCRVRIPLNPAADSERIRPPLGAPRRRASVVCPQWPTSV